MRVKPMASIWLAEWRALIGSGVYWWFAAVHLAASGVCLAVAWPTSVTFDAPSLPVAFNAVVYAQAAVMAYTASALAGENFALSDKQGAIDWVYYGVATPAEVIVARLAWTGSVLISLAALSLPLAIVSYALYPVPAGAVAGAAAAVLSALLCYTALGLVVSAAIAERSLRVIATDTAFIVLGVLLFFSTGWFGAPGSVRTVALNPLGAVHYYLSPRFGYGASFPWGAWIGVYGLALAALLGLAYRKLWEWFPPDWGPQAPAEPHAPGAAAAAGEYSKPVPGRRRR